MCKRVIVLMSNPTRARWPKQLPELSSEQKRISDDFMKYWHEVLPRRYGIVDDFNHRYPVRHAPVGFRRTLEIGAGIGEHLKYETLSQEQRQNYYALELRQNMADQIRARYPEAQVVVGDCQAKLDLPDGYFDRILAVHVLEHLPNLPATVKEMHRLCDPNRGVFSVVIPCEGSAAYAVARRLSAQRIFEKRYRQSYRWFIEREHINRPDEIMAVLRTRFDVVHRAFFPLPIALLAANLCIGLTLRPGKIHGP
jgi:SAM-dependent methyltransferase